MDFLLFFFNQAAIKSKKLLSQTDAIMFHTLLNLTLRASYKHL